MNNANAGKIPPLSIIINNVDTLSWVVGCLNALKAQDLFEDLQVVVVENASTDGSADVLAADFPWVDVVLLDTRVGFGEANNAGARVCTGRWLLLLNPDTVVHEGSLRELLETLDQHPDCQVAGGLIHDGEGEGERSTGSFPTFTSLALDTGLRWLSPLHTLLGLQSLRHWVGYDRARPVGWVTGAYLWIRRDLFEAIGGFDENIFMYCDDIDLCYRARQAGYPAYYHPVGAITHYRNKAPVTRSRKAMQRESQHYFAGKHYRSPKYWLTRLTFWALS